jgi:hypothetical protein
MRDDVADARVAASGPHDERAMRWIPEILSRIGLMSDPEPT